MKRFFLFLATLIPMVAGAGPRAWVAVGDSITKGWDQVTTPYPVRLAALRGHPVDDMGIGGDVAANIYSRWQRYAKPYPYAGVIIEECINDLNGGASGATCWATTQAFAEEARTAGFRVVLCTVFPVGNYGLWSAPKEVERDAYNTSARAYAAAHPGTVLLLDGDTVLSDDGEAIKASYDYGDGLHLNDTGAAALAAAISALISGS